MTLVKLILIVVVEEMMIVLIIFTSCRSNDFHIFYPMHVNQRRNCVTNSIIVSTNYVNESHSCIEMNRSGNACMVTLPTLIYEGIKKQDLLKGSNIPQECRWLSSRVISQTHNLDGILWNKFFKFHENSRTDALSGMLFWKVLIFTKITTNLS